MDVVKAYRNERFLASDEAREIRILSEYLEPRTRLLHAGVQRGIAVFGSARLRRGDTPDYYAMAVDLAERLARWTVATHPADARYHICTGGGPGIMEAAAEGTARVDRRLNVGLNISLLHEQHANPWLDPGLTFDFHYFFMRKFWFANLAQAVVAFPGGFGTMDELFEILTLLQTRKIRGRPVVLFGAEFWNAIVNFQVFVDRGLISARDLDDFKMVESVEEALEFLISRLADNATLPLGALTP
ncbi:MAG: LOG family protein [Nevskiaceae bacterium]|nr:MAG: LOG family protein [Nevskiaceae bacterium]TBR72226.1 MAG: LOG family protein [Nevskiaceae bacterium]